MNESTRLKVTDINQHFICILCDGYLIDATTIVECLHSFCRTCIVRYLENSRYCPVCDVQVHKTKPLQSIRSDTTLQDLVYKLIPGLYQNEMQRRREFYSEHPEAAAKCSSEERGEGAEQRCFYSPKENISLTLEYFHESESPEDSENSESKPNKDFMTRHLKCPAAMPIANLKKFIRAKFSIPCMYTIQILYADNLMSDDYTLMDIAYIYSWRRAGPMKFLYTFIHRKTLMKRSLNAAAVAATPEPLSKRIALEPTPVIQNGMDDSSNSSENLPTSTEESSKPDAEETNDSSANHQDALPADCCTPSDRLDTAVAAAAEVSAPPESSTSSEQMDVVVATEPPEPPPPDTSPKEATAEAVPSVQVVPTPQSTVLSTPNGIKLKIIHCPEPESKSRSKKSAGRKGGRTRYKSAPVQNRFPRLAPYPPPHTTACVGGPNIAPLSQLTMRKIAPTVMTSLSPNIVTALVSNTAAAANSPLCKNPTLLPTTAAPFLGGQPQLNVVTCNVTTQQITCNVTTPTNSFAARLPSVSSVARPAAGSPNVPCPSYLRGMVPSHVIAIPPMSSTASLTTPPVVVNGTATPTPVDSPALKPSTPQPNILAIPVESSMAAVLQTSVSSGSTTASNAPANLPLSIAAASKESPQQPYTTVSKPEEPPTATQQQQPPPSESPPSILKSALSDNKPNSAKKMFMSVLEDKPDCNGILSKPPQVSIEEQPLVMRSPEKKPTSTFEQSVKNSISAEFSDNDDLGCQADLVVDEQKLDSSDNEDDTDAALRKKITAIAEKEDEADGTDDTEGDSGRASDLSSQARSSCDDDIGSPMNAAAAPDAVSVPPPPAPSVVAAAAPPPPPPPSQLTLFPLPPVAPSAAENSRKSNNILHVINNLHKHHEKKDPIGALDLSTCTKKPGEGSGSRPKPVANPVLDIKHRQQNYLPAPNKPHTACVPSPKHPTTSPILMHGLTGHHPAVMGKSPHLPVPHFHNTPMVFSSQSRTMSSPSSMAGRSTPTTYSNTGLSQVPSAHQGMSPMLQGMLPCLPSPVMSPSFPIRAAGVAPTNHLKGVTPPPQNPYVKMTLPSHLKQSVRKSNSSDSHHAKSLSTPNRGNSGMASASFTPGAQASYPKSSLSNMKLSPHHRSASPAPSPKPMVPPVVTSSPSSHKSNQSIPMYKKSSSNSYKSYSYKYKGGNFSVINPDPNGNLQKLVIRNNDVRPHNHQKS